MNSIIEKATRVQMALAGLVPLDTNVIIEHRDAEGKLKPIFQENELCISLIKGGRLSPDWINRPSASLIMWALGKWSTQKNFRNLVPTAGKAGVASRINGAGAEALFDKIGWGTGVIAAAAGDTTLGTEVTLAGGAAAGVHVIAAATASRVTTTVTNDTAQLVGTATASAAIAITESGIFNAATNGTLLARQTFTAINVVSGDSIQFTWKVAAA